MASSRTEALGARLLDSLRAHPGTGRAWVAFSGGLDSTAVLLALHATRNQLSRELAAVHVDHGWHAHAADWAKHCEAVCAGLGIPFRVLRVHIETTTAHGPEATLREARYAALAELLAPGELLITGHHREDQAGTLLLNALRAAGSRGLAGMPANRPLGHGQLLRPALDEDRATLRECVLESGVDWIEDPGNEDPGLDRNFIHREVLPLLVTRWPDALRSLALSAAHARSDTQLLDALGDTLLAGHCDTAGVLSIDDRWLGDAATLRLIIRHWLRRLGCPPAPGRRLEEFCRQLSESRADRGARLDWAGHRLRHWQARLWLLDEDLPPCPVVEWDGGEALALGPALGRLELRGKARLPWPVTVGPRRGGERLATAGGQHHKVKELLRLADVPPWLRASVPILFRSSEPVALGDWMLAPELGEFLRATGSELRWTPEHPALSGLRGRAGLFPVESAA